MRAVEEDLVSVCVYTSYRDASIRCQFPSWIVRWGYSTLPTPEPTSQRKFTFPFLISKAKKSTWDTDRRHLLYKVYMNWYNMQNFQHSVSNNDTANAFNLSLFNFSRYDEKLCHLWIVHKKWTVIILKLSSWGKTWKAKFIWHLQYSTLYMGKSSSSA